MPALGDDQVFERYRIIRWLGSSSTGESYEAEDRLLLRKVTLKLIHPWRMLPDSARRQFFREMQGISTLNHPYLAAILDYGESDGRLYVARRYVSSGSLLGANGRLWYRPPLAVVDAFTYAHQLAQVLQYIHQHGYLHGSLTFTNVLVLRGPNVEQQAEHTPFLVADVGLANFVRRFGSPQVEALPVSAAPEQLSKRVTPASDQFALAVLLYFWLAGRPPYLGTPAEVEKLKLTETITPLSALNPGVTPEQDGIILRALAVYPEKRFPSVLSFIEALKSAPSAPVVPFHAFPTQPETPRTLLRFKRNEVSAEQPTETMTKLPASSRQKAGGDDGKPSGQADETDTTPQQSGPSPSTLEEFPSIPSTELPASENTPSSEQAHGQSSQESAVLSTLPETPRPEEGAIQEEATPRAAEPEAPADEAQAGQPAPEAEVAIEAQADQPEAEPTAEQPAQEGEVEARANNKPEVSKRPVSPEEVTSVASEVDAVSSPPLDKGGDAPQETEAADTSPEQPVTLEAQPAAEEASGTLPRLLIYSPHTDSPYEYILTGKEISIGRAGSSDLKLEQDDLTSRHHALLKREGERVLIFDKRSYNGVYINGQQIEVECGYELTDGDHIGIGNYELVFRSASGSSVSQAG